MWQCPLLWLEMVPYPSPHGFTGPPETLDGKAPGVQHTLHGVPVLRDSFSSATRQSQALLLWMTPGHCHSPAWPCSSSMVPTASSSTCYGATGVKGVFESSKGIPNPLWLLHSLLGCASQEMWEYRGRSSHFSPRTS